MKNKYIQIIAMFIAICLVTGIVLKIKISKINNDSQSKNENIDVNESEGEENIANKFTYFCKLFAKNYRKNLFFSILWQLIFL